MVNIINETGIGYLSTMVDHPISEINIKSIDRLIKININTQTIYNSPAPETRIELLFEIDMEGVVNTLTRMLTGTNNASHFLKSEISRLATVADMSLEHRLTQLIKEMDKPAIEKIVSDILEEKVLKAFRENINTDSNEQTELQSISGDTSATV